MMDDTGIDGGTETEAAEAPAESPGVDLSPVMERMDELAGTVGELRQQFQQPEAEPESIGNPWMPEGYEEEYAEENDPATAAYQAQQAQEVDRYLQQQIQQNLSPQEQRVQALEGRLNEMLLDNSVADLEERYPLLKEPEHAEAALQEAQTLAESLAQQTGDQKYLTLANNPQVIENAHLALRARASAESETPASTTVDPLEGAGGASPGESRSEDDIRSGILQAGRGGSLWGG